MKTKILTSILVGVLVTCFVSVGFAAAANGNGAGLERVPVFIGFRQTPGPSEQALVRAHGGAIKYSYTLVPAIAASIPKPAIEGLRRNPNVTIVEPDIEVYAVDAELDNSWGVKHIGAGFVHPTNTGADVKVAIIDTGIDYTHPDLDDNYKGGYDFVNSDSDPKDDNGHGTHCAGIVAAEDNDTGVVGVAPGAHLYALKVLNRRGSGNFSDVVAALQWAEANGMDVTSNSYGSSGDPGLTVRNAFSSAASAGIVNVCAAGNEGAGADTVIYPAKYDSCIAVAATDSDNIRASFSSTGPDVELAAPGVSIYSTYLYLRGGYATMSGTSMACPHVAGVIALMMSNGGYSRETLTSTATDLGDPGWDPKYGYGLVNAAAAVGVSDLPVAAFSATPTSGDAPLKVEFTDKSTGATSWSWTFGNGETSTEQNPFYTYINSGTYTVKLTATNADGSDTETKVNYITVSSLSVNQPPAASFTYTTDGLVVTFTDTSTDDGIITNWSWEFGDGSTSDAVNPICTYVSAGQYQVILTVTDDYGAEDIASQIVTVEATPLPGIYVYKLSGGSSWLSRVWWDAYVDMDIRVGASADPVKGAIVHGMWSTGQSAISQPTDDDGCCQVTLSIHKKNATVTFTVTDIVHPDYKYTEPEPPEVAPSIPIPRP